MYEALETSSLIDMHLAWLKKERNNINFFIKNPLTRDRRLREIGGQIDTFNELARRLAISDPTLSHCNINASTVSGGK